MSAENMSVLELQEIPEQLPAFAGQHGLGMKLDAVHRKGSVPDTHDRAVFGLRGRLQRFRQRLGDYQRVIPAGGERLLQAAEDSTTVMLNGRRLAVHQLRGANDLSAEGDADALMTEAHTEHRRIPSEAPNQFDRDARVLRPPGPG